MCLCIVGWIANNGVEIEWKKEFVIQVKADIYRWGTLRNYRFAVFPAIRLTLTYHRVQYPNSSDQTRHTAKTKPLNLKDSNALPFALTQEEYLHNPSTNMMNSQNRLQIHLSESAF
jgi:hypothetical protein